MSLILCHDKMEQTECFIETELKGWWQPPAAEFRLKQVLQT